MKTNGNLTNESERHHYIPQFLLKNWYGLDKQFQYYTCIYGKFISARTVAKSAGYEYHLYTDEIEKQNMQRIDTNAASAINKG